MKQFDWILFLCLILLLIFGEIAIYSASVQKMGVKTITYNFYIKQIIWILIGLGVFFIILFIPRLILDFIIVPGYVISLILLVIVLFLPATRGVHRWISLGGINIQPSEFAKLFTILLLGKVITKKDYGEIKKILYAFLIILPPVILIIQEPDLGSSLVIVGLTIPMLYAAGVTIFSLILLISPIISILVGFSPIAWIAFDIFLLVILLLKNLSLTRAILFVAINAFLSFLSPLFWHSLRSYQQQRIITFLNPSKDILGTGYQIIQSKIAIGSGKIFGKGFLQGTQKNLDFLPEKHTDFIFSVVGEEFGFFGCLVLITVFFFLIYRCFLILKKNQMPKPHTIIMGSITLITLQVVINIGMNLGLIPIVGIPLPFISYGGSNLLISIAAIALILKFEMERSFVYSQINEN